MSTSGPGAGGTSQNLHITVPAGARVVIVHPVPASRRTWYWFGGAVAASLIPFLPVVWHWVDNRPNTTGFYETLGRGELLAIAIVITIGGIAELAPASAGVKYSAGLIIGGALIALSEGFWYADVVGELMDDHQPPLRRLAWGSIALFVVSALISLRSVYLAAARDDGRNS